MFFLQTVIQLDKVHIHAMPIRKNNRKPTSPAAIKQDTQLNILTRL